MNSSIQKTEDLRWAALQLRMQEKKIIEAFKIFRGEGIEPILIKGWAAAKYYPQKGERLFADIDLCIEPGLFQKAFEISKLEEVRKLNVDVHKGLRHLDTVSWRNLFENSQLVKLDETDIRILRPEDHLRVLCVHWLNDGGAYKQRLLDIYYAIEKRPSDFDWNRLLDNISENRRRWIVCTIGLAHKYFNLSLKNTPIEHEAEMLPKWLIKSVEREWKSEVRLMPLHMYLHDKRRLLQQIWKRIPPNPIQATVELEGKFNDNPRVFYQVANIFTRIPALLKRFKFIIFEKTKIPRT